MFSALGFSLSLFNSLQIIAGVLLSLFYHPSTKYAQLSLGFQQLNYG